MGPICLLAKNTRSIRPINKKKTVGLSIGVINKVGKQINKRILWELCIKKSDR